MPIPQAATSPITEKHPITKRHHVTFDWLQWLNKVLEVLGLGFGNGAAGTAVTTKLKGTGTGPATPQTVVNYAKVTINGTTYWIPLMQ